MTFGQKIRELRLKADLTQRELAEGVGIEFTYLSKIENERVEPPSETVIRKIIEVLQGKLAQTIETDEIFVLAGKVPSEVTKDREVFRQTLAYFRTIQGEISNGDDLKRIARNSRKKKGE